MDVKELKQKSVDELHKLLISQRNNVRDIRFKIASKQSGNVRELREAKKTVAKILTLINVNKVTKNKGQ